MNIPPETVEKIKSVARLEDVIPNLQGSGKTLFTRCPKCGAFDERKKKGLVLNPSRQIVKCFSCGFGTNSPFTYLMETGNISYPEALAEIARIHSIDTESRDNRLERLEYERKLNDKRRDTFRDRQLRASGLTDDDITAVVAAEDGSEHHVFTFRSGTRDQYGNILPGQGDDMLIYYYDLTGRQVSYRQEKGNRMKPLVRIRWQNPDLHLDREGKPIKYESP